MPCCTPAAELLAVEFSTTHQSISAAIPTAGPLLPLQVNFACLTINVARLSVWLLVLLAITGRLVSQSTGCADTHPGLLGVRRLPLESPPCRINGFAADGALANSPDANVCEHVYVPGPTLASRASEPEKLNPVITLDQLPVENNAARSAQVVPSPAPALEVEKYRTATPAHDWAHRTNASPNRNVDLVKRVRTRLPPHVDRATQQHV